MTSLVGTNRRIRGPLDLLRPGTSDPSTASGRSRERYRRAVLATLASVAAKLAAALALLAAVRFVARSSSPEELGLWLLLVTAVALTGFADLGIGNSLLNVIAEAQGRDDDDEIRRAVSSSLVALTGLAVALAVVFAVVYPFADWASLLNVDGPTARHTGTAVAVFVALVLISLPLGVASRVNVAHQQGWVANLWVALGSGLSVAAVVVAVAMGARLPVLVAAMLGGLPVAYLLNTLMLFGWSRPDLRPRARFVTFSTARRVLRQGASFFVLAMAIAVGYQSDNLVISHYLGADAVTQYAVPFRIFMLFPTAVVLIAAPLWPAYSEALSRGDLEWVHRTLHRSTVLAIALTVGPSLVLVPLAPAIIDGWLGESVQVPMSLLLGLAAWAVVSGVSAALGMFFNGTGVLRFQVLAATAMAVVNLLASLLLVQRIGVAGPIWATVGSQVLCVLIPSWLIMRKLFVGSSDEESFRIWLHRWGRAPLGKSLGSDDDRVAPGYDLVAMKE